MPATFHQLYKRLWKARGAKADRLLPVAGQEAGKLLRAKEETIRGHCREETPPRRFLAPQACGKLASLTIQQ